MSNDARFEDARTIAALDKARRIRKRKEEKKKAKEARLKQEKEERESKKNRKRPFLESRPEGGQPGHHMKHKHP